jgi:tetratricopeptide (TPR) repeat protein
MKTFKLSLSLMLFLVLSSAVGGDGKFVEAMKKNIQLVYEAKEISQFQEAVNSFQRIASAEKNRWEPFYYIAFGNVMMANFEQDGAGKDRYLDEAVKALTQAQALAPEESEISALEGFIHMIRLTVDPQTRGMVHAPQAMQAYEKALKQNSQNPRAFALLAQMQFGTAKFFNSSTAEACANNSKAIELLDSYKSDNELAPSWGRRMAEGLTEACK